MAPRPPAVPKAAVAERFCHQVLVAAAETAGGPGIRHVEDDRLHAGQRLGVPGAVGPQKPVHAAGILLAEVFQLVGQQVHQHSDLAVRVVGEGRPVTGIIGDA